MIVTTTNKYAVAANQVMMAPVKLLTAIRNPWFCNLHFSRTLYQGNPDRNHNLWNTVCIERYILHNAGATGMSLHINLTLTMRKYEAYLAIPPPPKKTYFIHLKLKGI